MRDRRASGLGHRLWQAPHRTLAGSSSAGRASRCPLLYDGLHRLKNVDEGTLSGTSISTPAAGEQDWSLDQQGNWSGLVEKTAGTTDLNQSRAHNVVNEIDTDMFHSNGTGSSITATVGANWADPRYDVQGNLTESPAPGDETVKHKYTYDGWNRLVKVTDASNVVIATFEYDGLGRRIAKETPGGNAHYYYNEDWQLLEERASETGAPWSQLVHHPDYIDALAVRYNDSGQRDWYLQDANYNVTAMTDDSGNVRERYRYTPYGEVTVLNGASDGDGAEWTTDPNNATDISNTHYYTGRERDAETGLLSPCISKPATRVHV